MACLGLEFDLSPLQVVHSYCSIQECYQYASRVALDADHVVDARAADLDDQLGFLVGYVPDPEGADLARASDEVSTFVISPAYTRSAYCLPLVGKADLGGFWGKAVEVDHAQRAVLEGGQQVVLTGVPGQVNDPRGGVALGLLWVQGHSHGLQSLYFHE